MSSAYGRIPKPATTTSIEEYLPIRKVLRDGTEASLQSVDPTNEKLVAHLFSLFNHELEEGNTYPQENLMTEEQFRDYFLAYDAFILVKGDPIKAGEVYDYQDKVLGMYYVKPNYPGRCSHICNGGFVTSKIHRGKGAGVAMAETFMTVAPALGYKASVFNLVFANNEASIRIWRRLGFDHVGTIPQAARLRNSPDALVDAYIFYCDFSKKAVVNSSSQ